MTTPTSDTDDLVTRRLNSRSTPPADDAPADDDSTRAFATSSSAESSSAESSGAEAGTLPEAGKPSVLSDDEWAAVMADDAPSTEGGRSAGAESAAGTATASGATADTAEADSDPDAPRAVDLRVRDRGGSHDARGFLPGLARVWIAISVPLVVIALAMRVVITPVFSWFEYKIRPGFPVDSFGFSGDDRVHWASYVSGYLMNFDGSRFLSNLVFPTNGDKVLKAGHPVFKPGEVAHMHDVKTVIVIYFLVAAVLLIGSIIFGIYLARRTRRGLRTSLFSGSIVTLVFVIAVGIFAALRWNTFFSDFHSVFFKSGTWTFYDNDTLIRLYPDTFWTDAGIFIGGATIIVAILLFIFNWPRKSRGQRAAV